MSAKGRAGSLMQRIVLQPVKERNGGDGTIVELLSWSGERFLGEFRAWCQSTEARELVETLG